MRGLKRSSILGQQLPRLDDVGGAEDQARLARGLFLVLSCRLCLTLSPYTRTKGVRKFPEVSKEVVLTGGGKGVNKSNWLADRPQGRPGTAGLCVNKVLRGIAFGFTSWTS